MEFHSISRKPTIAKVRRHAVAGGSDIALACDMVVMAEHALNRVLDNTGLASTQMVATIFDGITRHSPEGVWLEQRAEEVGFRHAVRECDSGEPVAPHVSR